MDRQLNIPCGWSGSIHTFLSLSKQDWLTALHEHHQRCMNCPADESQQAAWAHSVFYSEKIFSCRSSGIFFSKIFAAPIFFNFFNHSENFVNFFSDLPEFLKKISGNFLRPSNFFWKFFRILKFFFEFMKIIKNFFVKFFSGCSDESLKTMLLSLFSEIRLFSVFHFLPFYGS